MNEIGKMIIFGKADGSTKRQWRLRKFTSKRYELLQETGHDAKQFSMQLPRADIIQ